jgi:hypothetical protein
VRFVVGAPHAVVCRFLLPGIPKAIKVDQTEHEARDVETLPVGLRTIHVPADGAGQSAIPWPELMPRSLAAAAIAVRRSSCASRYDRISLCTVSGVLQRKFPEGPFFC